MLQKEADMAALAYRSDFSQILSIATKNNNPNFIAEIEQELFDTSSSEEDVVQHNEDGSQLTIRKSKENVRIDFMENKVEAIERLAASIIKSGENKYLEAMGLPAIIDETPLVSAPPKKTMVDKKKGTKSQKGDVLKDAETLLNDDDDHLD